MKKLRIIFLLLIFSCFSYSQENYPSKNELIKLFKESIKQKENRKINTYSNPWVADNKDSLYFKANTIKLTNYKTANAYSEICESLNWTFYKKSKFVISYLFICDEPTYGLINKPEDWIELKIAKSKDDLLLTLINSDQVVDEFRVASLKDKKDRTELILERIE